jgi:hypothetical protein
MANSPLIHLPVDSPEYEVTPLVARPKSLKGLKVGLLDNGKEFSDVVLDALAKILVEKYEVGEIVFWRKGFPAKGAPFIAEMAASCDVAVSGVGHCGSSSPWSVIDAVRLEQAGTPAVALISASFCPLSKVVARSNGLATLPIIRLSHPIGDPDPAKISSKGTDAASEVVRLLTGDAKAAAEEFVAKQFPLPEHAVARI